MVIPDFFLPFSVFITLSNNENLVFHYLFIYFFCRTHSMWPGIGLTTVVTAVAMPDPYPTVPRGNVLLLLNKTTTFDQPPLTSSSGCRVFSHYQAILWYHLGVLIQLNSDTTWKNCQIPQVKGSILHNGRPLPTHPHIPDTHLKARSHIWFWPTSYRLEVSTASSLESINVLELPIETIYLPSL